MPAPPNIIARGFLPSLTQEKLQFRYLSELLGRAVQSASDGKSLGKLIDFTATPEKTFPRVTGVLVKRPFHAASHYIAWNRIHWDGSRGAITVRDPISGENADDRPSETDILLKKSFLDRQLISTTGYKVVRVNDLHLLIDMAEGQHSNLWLVHIDIGLKGLLRRLGWERAGNAIVHWILDRDMRDVLVPWKYVQTATAANVYGSLRLSTDSSKLSEIHPADLADILEDLGAEERNRMIESLDPTTAAATLSEMPLTLRVRIAESIRAPALAHIVHEMQTDNLVDLLDDLSPESRTALMATFSADRIAEIKELSQLSPATVGSIMNTDFLVARASTTVHDALEIIRSRLEDTELISYVYVVDNDQRLCGVASLRYILDAEPEMLLADVMQEHPISVSVETTIKRAARIFFKYKFAAVPVADDDGRIRGIVTMRDALEAFFPEVREESKG